MISYLQRWQRVWQGKSWAASLLLIYILFAMAPFLLLHTHSDKDHRGSHAETTHAHAWDFWTVHDEHDEHNEASEHERGPESGTDPVSHLEDIGEEHEGMDLPHRALASSHPSPVHFQVSTFLLLNREPPLPKSVLQCLPARVPISSDSHPDEVSSLITCDLPPPHIA